MRLRKIVTMLFLCLFVVQSIGFAAIGGKRGGGFSMPRKSPSVSSPAKTPGPAAKPQSGYKPSKDAKSLEKDAPAAGAKSNANAAQSRPAAPQTSMMGGMLRNMAIFGGGMLIGSMLANLFGLHGGFFADLLGILVNVALVVVVVKLAMLLWRKFRQRKDRESENIYRRRK